MADLIDRQAAIDALEKHEKSNGHNYTLFVDIVAECEEIIRDLPSAQQWIPCGADFPKKDGDYLVTTYNGQLARYIFNKGNSEEYWTRCVTAWMPLPEPYKGERK